MSETVRLAKRVAELFNCSRSEATNYIEGGGVTVDGVVVEEAGFRVGEQARIELLPQASAAPVEPVSILLHKPAGISVEAAAALIVPGNQFAEDHTGLRLLNRHTVGLAMPDPLVNAASGLMVFTQDWRTRRALVEDLNRVEQEYIAEVSGTIIPDGLQLLNKPVSFNGKPSPQLKASWQNETRLRFAGKSVSASLVMHLCQCAGLTVVSVRRIRLGRVPMAGLPAGQWRFLSPFERF